MNGIVNTCICPTIKMTAGKKVYYTRFVQDILEYYIHMLLEFNSLEACQLLTTSFNFKIPKITELDGKNYIFCISKGTLKGQTNWILLYSSCYKEMWGIRGQGQKKDWWEVSQEFLLWETRSPASTWLNIWQLHRDAKLTLLLSEEA